MNGIFGENYVKIKVFFLIKGLLIHPAIQYSIDDLGTSLRRLHEDNTLMSLWHFLKHNLQRVRKSRKNNKMALHAGRHIYKPYPDGTEAGNQPISLATRGSDIVFSSHT
ncbi:hypothetical protein AVEN_32307-1 [Araneus ventricosus]|uniref:Uncharacterized protein n=1 Tax=Araneus ventricosus TaxID=182803 RepID=A0A4Y2MB18_ARAVE|nr:hypothetical protein AVEN_32307-1 [Araneus ventricosus]